MTPDRFTTLLGIDGLTYHAGGLIAIQNGVRPHRVIRLRLGPQLREIASVEVLEANHPLFDEPTLGTVLDNWFYYIANSGWPQLDDLGGFRETGKPDEPVILKLRL